MPDLEASSLMSEPTYGCLVPSPIRSGKQLQSERLGSEVIPDTGPSRGGPAGAFPVSELSQEGGLRAREMFLF